MRSHIGWEKNEASFIRVWKPLPSRLVLKTLRGSPKGKIQRGQYLLAVGLGRYKFPLVLVGTTSMFVTTVMYLYEQEDSEKTGKVTSIGMYFLHFQVYKMDSTVNAVR